MSEGKTLTLRPVENSNYEQWQVLAPGDFEILKIKLRPSKADNKSHYYVFQNGLIASEGPFDFETWEEKDIKAVLTTIVRRGMNDVALQIEGF